MLTGPHKSRALLALPPCACRHDQNVAAADLAQSALKRLRIASLDSNSQHQPWPALRDALAGLTAAWLSVESWSISGLVSSSVLERT